MAPGRRKMATMSTHSLRELHADLGSVVLEVAYTGEEAIVTDNGTEIAVIISMAEYERLQERIDSAPRPQSELKRAGATT
jgi:antitoxin YefM